MTDAGLPVESGTEEKLKRPSWFGMDVELPRDVVPTELLVLIAS